MSILGFLIPLALMMGMAGLASFFWAMKVGQFDDLDGAANRILIEDDGPAEAVAPRAND